MPTCDICSKPIKWQHTGTGSYYPKNPDGTNHDCAHVAGDTADKWKLEMKTISGVPRTKVISAPNIDAAKQMADLWENSFSDAISVTVTKLSSIQPDFPPSTTAPVGADGHREGASSRTLGGPTDPGDGRAPRRRWAGGRSVTSVSRAVKQLRSVVPPRTLDTNRAEVRHKAELIEWIDQWMRPSEAARWLEAVARQKGVAPGWAGGNGWTTLTRFVDAHVTEDEARRYVRALRYRRDQGKPLVRR